MRTLLPALLICICLAGSHAASQAVPSVPARTDRAASFYHSRDGFLGLVAVSRNHHLVFLRGYGYADLDSKTPFTASTRFRIGSLSKQFTAVAILLLQQEGKLQLSDSISLYYPDAPAAWGGITLHNLLTQTSGIQDVDFGLILKNHPHTPEELMHGIPELPLRFPPGTRFEYANINYMLLGKVIEHVSHKPYCQLLQERLFTPLQLTETGCDWNALPAPQRAHGYRPALPHPIQVEDDDLSSIAGAGSLSSSAGDLIRWTEALFHGKVLSSASLRAMTTPFKDEYGYGLELHRQDRTLDISHDGMVDGFTSWLDYIPRKKTTVVVLSNLVGEGNHSSPGTLALDTEVVRLVVSQAAVLPSEGKEVSVPRKLLSAYTGRYRSADPQHRPVVFRITLQNGHLYLQDESQASGSARMMAESTSTFYLPNQAFELIFDHPAGSGLAVIDFPNLAGGTLKRIADSTLTSEPTPLILPPPTAWTPHPPAHSPP